MVICLWTKGNLILLKFIIESTNFWIFSVEMATPENTNMSNMSAAFKQMIDRDKLTGSNFNDWYRSLRIILRMAKRYDYLGEPLPTAPAENASQAEKDAYNIEYEKHNDVACLMLAGMDTQLQKQFEHYGPKDMITELQRLFQKPQLQSYMTW